MIWSEKLGHEIGTYNSLGGLKINPKPFDAYMNLGKLESIRLN